ncbi:hypothetical protein PIB30_080633 [Stylosanthes scabra]|uniref:Uncharacterized protein n=1 Tax=Stylosanthes scabra TaxID=79078 RepID=A0ABU6VSI0_9FABA|nr:hypothetical protein [Stylosanthes scabra]
MAEWRGGKPGTTMVVTPWHSVIEMGIKMKAEGRVVKGKPTREPTGGCNAVDGFFLEHFQQSSVPLLFDTVEQLLQASEGRRCKFILAYVSRAKTMDSMIVIEASKHQMQMKEVAGTRRIVGNLEGVIYEITLKSKC